MALRLSAIAIGCTLAVLVAAPATAAPRGADRMSTLEQAVMRELNNVRATKGLPALSLAPGLRTAAVKHSRAMLARGFFEHASADGTPFWARIKKTYPQLQGAWSVGENLFMKTAEPTARETVDAWLASPPHRQILLSGKWREVGVAVVSGGFGGNPAWLVTADFGAR